MTDPRLLDKNWRLSNLYKIRTKNAELVKFKMNRAQTHYHANKHTRNIILKSRQLGFTTYETVDTLDDTMFTQNMDALFIAHIKGDAEDIFDKKVRIAWENMNPHIADLYKIETNRTNQMTFDFGDGTKSNFSVKVSGRSGTFRRLHVTEFAKVCVKEPKKAKEIVAGTIPAVPIDGRVDIESTAEGEIGLFYEMFWEAWERKRAPLMTEFKAHFYNWTWDDEEINKITHIVPFNEMDEGGKFEEYARLHKLSDKEITYYYLKWLSLKKDWNLLHQEYPTTVEEAFVSTGNKLFDTDKLDSQEIKEGMTVGDWIYYKKYNSLHTYGVGADPSEGIGGDNATIVVVDFTTGEVVAVFCSKFTTPDVLAIEIAKIGREYGNALVCPERNNHGYTTLVELNKVYNNIYEEIVYDKIRDKRTKKLGFTTTSTSKPRILYNLNTAINEDEIQVPDKALLRELRTYQKEDLNEMKHDEETIGHWDRLMALAIAWEMRNYVDYTLDKTKEQKEEDEESNGMSWEEKFNII